MNGEYTVDGRRRVCRSRGPATSCHGENGATLKLEDHAACARTLSRSVVAKFVTLGTDLGGCTRDGDV